MLPWSQRVSYASIYDKYGDFGLVLNAVVHERLFNSPMTSWTGPRSTTLAEPYIRYHLALRLWNHGFVEILQKNGSYVNVAQSLLVDDQTF